MHERARMPRRPGHCCPAPGTHIRGLGIDLATVGSL